MPIPIEQCPQYGATTAKAPRKSATTTIVPHLSHHRRHGDRGNPDDADTAPLRRWVRFRDLAAAGIIGNWPTLLRLVAEEGFPSGRMIGPNTRAWLASEVEDWLDTRPLPRGASIDEGPVESTEGPHRRGREPQGGASDLIDRREEQFREGSEHYDR